MRHHVYGRKLNRDRKERRALFRSLVRALLIHGKIQTTPAKAKSVVSMVEKLITQAKRGSVSGRQKIESELGQHDAVRALYSILPKCAHVSSGYVRIRRSGVVSGNNAETVTLQFVHTDDGDDARKRESTRSA